MLDKKQAGARCGIGVVRRTRETAMEISVENLNEDTVMNTSHFVSQRRRKSNL